MSLRALFFIIFILNGGSPSVEGKVSAELEGVSPRSQSQSMVIPGLSSRVMDKIVQKLGLQSAVDKLPVDLASTIQPTLDVNPEPEIRLANGGLSDGTTSTLLTANTKIRRTYIHAIDLTVAKDAAATSLFTLVAFTPKGQANTSAIILRYEPLTAGSHNKFVAFPDKIEIEPGSTVVVNNSLGVASIDVSATIFFSEEEAL